MFAQGDMYQADISKATVLALFLLPSNIEKLVPKFLDLPAGTRIVANTFWVSDWTPDDTVMLKEGCENWCTSHLFIIPARVEGKWQLPDGVVSLTQRYQMVQGTYTPKTGTPAEVKGRLRGATITVTVGTTEYEGTGDRQPARGDGEISERPADRGDADQLSAIVSATPGIRASIARSRRRARALRRRRPAPRAAGRASRNAAD